MMNGGLKRCELKTSPAIGGQQRHREEQRQGIDPRTTRRSWTTTTLCRNKHSLRIDYLRSRLLFTVLVLPRLTKKSVCTYS